MNDFILTNSGLKLLDRGADWALAPSNFTYYES